MLCPNNEGDRVGWASGIDIRREWTGEAGIAATLKPSLEATWVLLCGLVASGRLRWDGAILLRALAAWLLVDVLIGCVYTQLLVLKRARPVLSRPSAVSAVSSKALRIPYAAPGSPAERLGALLGDLLPDLRYHTLPSVGGNSVTAVVAAALALTWAAFLGTQPLVAVAGALLGASGLTALAGDSAAMLDRGQRGMRAALAWILAYLVLGPMPFYALGLGLLVGLGAYGRSLLRDVPGGGARAVNGVVWLVMASSLLLWRQPVPAVLVITAGTADHIAVAGLDGVDADRGVTRGRLSWLLSTLVLALAVVHWA